MLGARSLYFSMEQFSEFTEDHWYVNCASMTGLIYDLFTI